MEVMEIIDEKTIKLDRELNELDRFVIRFIRIFEKHTSYVIISGYVAILFGRTRGTEDVDLIIPQMDKENFKKLYQDLLNNNFWSVTVDSIDELYSMLEDSLAIRLADRGKVLPNIEIKFVKDELDKFSLKNKIEVITKSGSLFTSRIELQIVYKKFVLKSQKDLEDARHLQKLFELDDEKINQYKILLEKYERL